MPSDGQVATGGDEAISLTPEFETASAGGTQGKGLSGPFWKATRVADRAGPRASEAQIEIPLSAARDEIAPSVTLVDGSAATGIKGGDFVTVKAAAGSEGGVIFAGSVVNISQGIKSDVARITAQDHKYILDGLPIKGSFWLSDGGIIYRQGVHFIPNKNGEPNCAKVDGQYVMCVPRMGLDGGEDPPDEPSSTVCSYWKVKFVLANTRYRFADSGAATLASDFKEFKQIPSQIVWPAGFVNSISDDDIPDRRAKEMDYEGMKCTAALNSLCAQAGPYGLYMKPDTEYKNELQIVRMQYKDKGLTIGRAAGGNAADVLVDQAVVTDGTFDMNFEETFTLCTVSGDLVYIERRVQSYGTITFKEAWTDDQKDNWKLKITNGDPGNGIAPYSIDAFRAASNEEKKVFRAYKIAEDFEFMGGTSQSDFPRAVLPRAVLPHLLKQVLDTGETASDTFPVDVPILFEGSDDGTNWFLMPTEHSMHIDERGILWLHGYYQETDTGWCTWQGNYINADTLEALESRYLRVTFAIPCDHRITANYKISTDNTQGVDSLKKNDDAERLNSTHLSRVFYADAMELYRRALQAESFPLPESQGGEEENDDGLLDDTEKAKQHCKRRLNDLGRVHKSGRLIIPHVHAGYKPGDAIAKIQNRGGSGGFVINSVVHEVVWTETPQLTELVLG